MEKLNKIAEKAGEWLFSLPSVLVHTVIFAAWFVTRGFGSDNSGFTIGTAILSLEAIYITLLVGYAVRLQSAREGAHNRQVTTAHTRMLQDNEKLMDRQNDALDAILDQLGG